MDDDKIDPEVEDVAEEEEELDKEGMPIIPEEDGPVEDDDDTV